MMGSHLTRYVSRLTWVALVGFLVLFGIGSRLAAPTSAGSELPPRPTLTPTPAPPHEGSEVGAHIVLEVVDAPADAWSVVQWQDFAGGWHDVEGWRGSLDQSGMRRWWVAPKDFDTGPFRWVVTQGQGGAIVWVSESFSLPAKGRETVLVTNRSW